MPNNDEFLLEKIWDESLDKIRDGIFSSEKAEQSLRILQQIKCDKDLISKKLVSLMWIIPLFLTWNKERCLKNGADNKEFDNYIDRTTNIIIEKLGHP